MTETVIFRGSDDDLLLLIQGRESRGWETDSVVPLSWSVNPELPPDACPATPYHGYNTGYLIVFFKPDEIIEMVEFDPLPSLIERFGLTGDLVIIDAEVVDESHDPTGEE